MTAIAELSAREIARRVLAGQHTAVDIANAFLARTEEVGNQLNAWTALDPRYVLSQARGIDALNGERGALAGVPVGVKDIFNTEFYPTEKGSPAWTGYRAGNDARCVSYLRFASGLVFGKTDTSEFAVHALGKSRNPYKLSHVTGSSSGGSAVAVATGMVPVALGTQTGGSIIRPASWCGVFAMKPSFGLIPRTGVLKTTDTLDTVGFFARHADDLPLMLEVLRVHGSNFPIHEARLAAARDNPPKTWRIGFARGPFEDRTAGYVTDAMRALRERLSKIPGVECVDLALPASAENFQALHRRIYHPDLGYYLKAEMARAADKISPVMKAIFEDSKTIPPEDYPVAMREQAALAADLERCLAENRIDVLLSNSSNGSAPHDAEPDRHLDLNALWTMTWLPVINVPQFTCKDGLPFGLQLVGAKFSDYRLFALLQKLVEAGISPATARRVDPPYRN